MSSRFVNPFTDLGFKIIFGQPASKALLIILLNELLSGEHHIEDLTFLDKEDRSENIHDKGIIYDLYCRTSTGEYIIVEMQNRWHSHFLDRTLYYVCRAVSRQMENPSSKEVCVPDTPLEGLHQVGTSVSLVRLFWICMLLLIRRPSKLVLKSTQSQRWLVRWML